MTDMYPEVVCARCGANPVTNMFFGKVFADFLCSDCADKLKEVDE